MKKHKTKIKVLKNDCCAKVFYMKDVRWAKSYGEVVSAIMNLIFLFAFFSKPTLLNTMSTFGWIVFSNKTYTCYRSLLSISSYVKQSPKTPLMSHARME